MRDLFALLAASLVLFGTARAQAIPVSELTQPVAVGLPTIDDIVEMQNGTLVVSLPAAAQIAIFAAMASPQLTPLPIPNVAALGICAGPDGALYIGDAISGSVLRHDLGTGATTVFASGFNLPVDLVFETPSELWVADLTNNDFFGGPCDLHRLDVASGQVVADNLIVAGVPGAADIEFSGNGQLYVASLGSIVAGVIDTTTLAVQPLGNNLFLPSDIVIDGRGRLLISTIYEARIWEIDPASGGQIEVASFVGPGSGAEDLALLSSGDVLLTVSSGEIHLVDRSSALHQVGAAHSASTFRLRVAQPSRPGWHYALAVALSATTGLPIAGTSLIFPLDNDPLLSLSISQPRPAPLIGFDGTLDADGFADAQVAVLSDPSFIGVSFYFGGLLWPSFSAPVTSFDVTNAVRVTVVP